MVFHQIENINKDMEFINKNQIAILKSKTKIPEIQKIC